jgi:hypothetical protein
MLVVFVLIFEVFVDMRVSRLPDVLYIPVRLDAMLVVFVLIFEVFVSIFAPLGCVKIPANPETVTMSAALVAPVAARLAAVASPLAVIVISIIGPLPMSARLLPVIDIPDCPRKINTPVFVTAFRNSLPTPDTLKLLKAVCCTVAFGNRIPSVARTS